MSSRQTGQDLVAQLPDDGASTVRIEVPWGRLEVITTDTDRLGVMVRAVQIDRLPGSVHRATLRGHMQDLAEQVDYLSERLTLVEHDPARTGALMRSAPPREVSGERHYFELRVEKNRAARFARFRQPPGATDREQLPFLLDRN